MPRAEIPAGVKRYDHDLVRVGEYSDGVLNVECEEGDWLKVSDLPAIKAHWLEQLKEELLSDAVIDAVAEARAIEALYGRWQYFPAREANQKARYAQLAKKPGVQESWKKGARREAERFLAAMDSIPIEEGGDGD